MAECPFCHGRLEQSDLDMGKCLVCGTKLPVGIADAPPSGEPGSLTQDDRGIAVTVDVSQLFGKVAEPVAPLWEGKFDEAAGPRASIGRSGPEAGDDPNLVIQPRLLSDPVSAARLQADYVMLGQLGKGGMGVVLAARQTSVDRTVALKKISPSFAKDPESRRKFLTEAVVTGDLEHPNIVPIYDVGKDESGLLFYSMKHVKGTPWDQVISQKTLAENVEILMKVADAVAFAHSRDVIHRDLKPENVMLGGYGEVLVMDWGLAIKLGLPSAKAAGMGGTPAYMAPEMIFTRPEHIGFPADIYLLGAILYEIVTGSPPHEGATVSACLSAASENRIRPTDKDDELVSIALKAMATQPEERYACVADFQEAIRQYWSHSQSVLLSNRAAEDLKVAETREDYDRYARALLGFQEAYELWEGNARAKAGIAETSVAYARRALSKRNFDLAASLLDETNAEHVSLLREIRAAQKEQDARQQRLKTAKRVGAALAATILIVVSVAFFWIKSEYNRAEGEKIKAQNSEQIAISERQKADRQKAIAQAAEQSAIRDKIAAETARHDEEIATKKAIKAKNAAVLATQAETKAKNEAVTARRKEEYGAYIARIGLASSKVEENAFRMVRTLLGDCPERLRNWEWGRLMYLCQQSDRTFQVPERIETLTLSPDGKRFVTGGESGIARMWDTTTGREIFRIQTGGQYVFAAAFSPDGKHLALGTNQRPAFLQFYDARTGGLEWAVESRKGDDGKIVGHEDAVLSVAYSHDGKRLLSSSYDNTARLWDLEKREEIQVFRGHDWWVWSAAFSPDERWIVTASQDGSAIVWDVASGEARATFRGHAGPVYAATFAPGASFSSNRKHDEQTLPHILIASGGYDKRVMLWWPDAIRGFNFGALARPMDADASPLETVLPANTVVLQGHTAGIRAIEFSDDGQLLATGSNDNTIRVWNVATGQLVKTLRGHSGRVRAVAFAPGGKGGNRQLFSGGHDSQVRLWDLHRYEEMRILDASLATGGRDAILGAAFSPSGEQIVTACRDRTARLWDRDGSPLLEFKQGHQYLTSTAVFYPDARRLLTAAMDGTTRVWDLSSGAQMLLLEKTGASAAVTLSHNGKWILSGGDSEDATGAKPPVGDKKPLGAEGEQLWPAQLWDAETGVNVRTLRAHHAEVTAVAFSPDDQLLFTGDANGRARIWLLAAPNGGPPQKIHVRGITSAVFLRQGEGLLTASGDNSVAYWDIVSGPDGYGLAMRKILRHPDAVSSMAVSSDGSCVVTACADKIVRFWDLSRGEETCMILADRNHDARLLDPSAAAEVVARRDTELADLRQRKQTLLAAAPNRALTDEEKRRTELEFRDFDKMEQLITGREEINAVGFSPDGALAVTTSTDGKVRLWDWRNRREVGSGSRDTCPAFKSAGGHAWSTAFSPNGAYLATVGGSDARIWRRSDGIEISRLGPQGAVAAAHFSQDGAHVVTASWDNTARIWNAHTGQLEHELQGHTKYVNDATFSLDGTRVLTASDDKTAILWDARTGQAIHRFAGHSERIRSATLLCQRPSGSVLKVLTASDDGTARIWEPDGKMIRELKGHGKAVLDADFSPDGKFVLTGGDDNRAILWNVQDGSIKLSLEGHTAAVSSVAFSLDGLRAVTGSRDNSVKVWELETGKELLTLKGHTQEVTSVSFSPDQKTILTSALDGTWIQWHSSGLSRAATGE